MITGSLPPELIRYILLFGCDWDLSVSPNESRAIRTHSRRPKPFVRPALQVCSTWRNTVLGTQALWLTSLRISSIDLPANIHDLIGASKGSDFDINVDGLNAAEPAWGYQLSVILDLLLSVSHRWRSLSITGSSPENLVFYGNRLLGEECTTRLRALKLRHRGLDYLGMTLPTHRFMLRMRAPSLQYICLHNSAAKMWDPSSHISEISHLEISTFSLQWMSLRAWLTHVTRVQSLDIKVDNLVNTELLLDSIPKPILLQNLINLSLNVSQTFALGVLRTLEMPCLTSLHLDISHLGFFFAGTHPEAKISFSQLSRLCLAVSQPRQLQQILDHLYLGALKVMKIDFSSADPPYDLVSVQPDQAMPCLEIMEMRGIVEGPDIQLLWAFRRSAETIVHLVIAYRALVTISGLEIMTRTAPFLGDRGVSLPAVRSVTLMHASSTAAERLFKSIDAPLLGRVSLSGPCCNYDLPLERLCNHHLAKLHHLEEIGCTLEPATRLVSLTSLTRISRLEISIVSPNAIDPSYAFCLHAMGDKVATFFSHLKELRIRIHDESQYSCVKRFVLYLAVDLDINLRKVAIVIPKVNLGEWNGVCSMVQELQLERL